MMTYLNLTYRDVLFFLGCLTIGGASKRLSAWVEFPKSSLLRNASATSGEFMAPEDGFEAWCEAYGIVVGLVHFMSKLS